MKSGIVDVPKHVLDSTLDESIVFCSGVASCGGLAEGLARSRRAASGAAPCRRADDRADIHSRR